MIEEAELLVESNSHPLQAFCDKVRALLGKRWDPEIYNGDVCIHEIPELPEPSGRSEHVIRSSL